MVKNLLATQEAWVRSLGQADPLEKGMAAHSRTLSWRIPRTGEPRRLQSKRSQRVGNDRAANAFQCNWAIVPFWCVPQIREQIKGHSYVVLIFLSQKLKKSSHPIKIKKNFFFLNLPRSEYLVTASQGSP